MTFPTFLCIPILWTSRFFCVCFSTNSTVDLFDSEANMPLSTSHTIYCFLLTLAYLMLVGSTTGVPEVSVGTLITRPHLRGWIGGSSPSDMAFFETFEDEKRASPQRVYSFGLGKKSDGLPLHPYGFGLGKKAHAYNFGLGKKSNVLTPSSFSPYGFGLGKRSDTSSSPADSVVINSDDKEQKDNSQQHHDQQSEESQATDQQDNSSSPSSQDSLLSLVTPSAPTIDPELEEIINNNNRLESPFRISMPKVASRARFVRRPNLYSFGLGKRAAPVNGWLNSIYLGENGLFKRKYNFGLGKRSADDFLWR